MLCLKGIFVKKSAFALMMSFAGGKVFLSPFRTDIILGRRSSMNSGFRLGKILGINIHIDWSWLLIFALVSWSLATSFSAAHPDWSISLRWGLAVVAALLFFTSILIA
jgi:hypothetical protein